MQELIDLLKKEHNFSDEQAKTVAETIFSFLKSNPGITKSLSASNNGSTETNDFYTKDQLSSSPAASYIPDEALKNNETVSKDKQSGFYEGNKKDY